MSSYLLRAICRPELAAGFGLAGIHCIEATGPEQAADRLRELRARPDVGLVFVQDDLLETDRQPTSRRALPMVVPVPGPRPGEAGGAAEEYVAEILRRAIGYRVRLQ